MSLIPVGHAREMKKQMVRPVFTTDLSALLKLAAPMPPQPPGVQTENIDLTNGDSAGADQAGGDGGNDTAGGLFDPNDLQNDFGAPVGPPQGEDDGTFGPTPTDIPQAGNPQDESVKSDEQEEAEAHSDVLKLRYALGTLLDKAGLDYDPDVKPDSLTITVTVSPKITIQSTGKQEPAHIVLQPLVHWAHRHRMGVKEQVRNNIADARAIAPTGNKPGQKKQLTFIFSYQAKQEAAESVDQDTVIAKPVEQSIGGAAKQKVPLNSDKQQQMQQPKPQVQPTQQLKAKPQGSKLGNPGEGRKAAQLNKTMREVFASRKDELVKTLAQIIGK